MRDVHTLSSAFTLSPALPAVSVQWTVLPPIFAR